MAVLVTAIFGLMCGRPPPVSVDPRDEREDDGEVAAKLQRPPRLAGPAAH